jgi:hypothetical protein
LTKRTVFGALDIEDRHAVDRRGWIGFGSRARHIAGAGHKGGVGRGEVAVDLAELEDIVVGTFASASSTFMWPGMRPATGWIAYFTVPLANRTAGPAPPVPPVYQGEIRSRPLP